MVHLHIMWRGEKSRMLTLSALTYWSIPSHEYQATLVLIQTWHPRLPLCEPDMQHMKPCLTMMPEVVSLVSWRAAIATLSLESLAKKTFLSPCLVNVLILYCRVYKWYIDMVLLLESYSCLSILEAMSEAFKAFWVVGCQLAWACKELLISSHSLTEARSMQKALKESMGDMGETETLDSWGFSMKKVHRQSTYSFQGCL